MTVRDRADAELLDDVPERPGVVPHPAITSHDRDNLRRFAEQLGRCKMHRIERADRLDGKGAADAGEHRSVNVENEAPPLEGSQGSNGRLFFCCGQPKGRARSTPCTECSPRQPGVGGRAWLLSDPSGVAGRYASPRSLSISSAAVPGGSRMSGQSSNGSPASTGGWRTPAAMSSSHRLPGDVRAPRPGGTSSATTRPCAVTEIRSPASIRRM